MLDLIRIAWGFEADRILAGELAELDRFDVVARVPPDSTADSQKLMLQTLLKDRFKLSAHEETKPIPTWALTVGKKPLMKEADGSGDTGCKLRDNGSGDNRDGGMRSPSPTPTAKTPQSIWGRRNFALFLPEYDDGCLCRGFAHDAGVIIATPVVDRTGLQGRGTSTSNGRWVSSCSASAGTDLGGGRDR